MILSIVHASELCNAIERAAQADKEQGAFEGEWKKLGAIIDQDKRNRELLRQRAMEERNRKTQEVRPLHFQCLWCCSETQLAAHLMACLTPQVSHFDDGRRLQLGVTNSRTCVTHGASENTMSVRANARAAAEEPRGGGHVQGRDGRPVQGGQARAVPQRREREHGDGAGACLLDVCAQTLIFWRYRVQIKATPLGRLHATCDVYAGKPLSDGLRGTL